MPYSLGQVDCSDPTEVGNAACGGSVGSSGSGFDLNNLLNTALNDITQIVKPGSPALRPLYTPTSSALTSLGSNPLLLLALVGGAIYLAKRR